MGLQKYEKKRSFEKTPEPKGGKAGSGALRFVVQKHDASRLHYDFRLEMDGVLKSWAIPKGPSTDPSVRRLAVQVEDHPYAYKDFEGTIPEGNYGAGTVIIWDEGEYEPITPAKGKKAQEKELLNELRDGSLKIILHGQKLKGEFALVRAGGMGDNAWLLIKHRDAEASSRDITKDNKSVRTGEPLAPRHRGKKKPAADESGEDPPPVVPMLATLTDAPFDREGWSFEIKWDGYRALCFRDGAKTELRSRNDQSFNERFYAIYDAVAAWDIRAVVDGEIVVADENGVSHFNDLQHWHSKEDGPLYYYVFDLLWLNGRSLLNRPLSERQELLRSLIPPRGPIRMGIVVETSGLSFYQAAQKLGLEGIMAKRMDSLYRPGTRSKDWLKMKIQQRQEVVIAGYTRKRDSPRSFSSLLLALREKGQWRYAGKVGTGFSDAFQKELLSKLKPRDTSPLSGPLTGGAALPPHTEIVWTEPERVAEINYTEITPDGVFRHPSFVALRDDKRPANVQPETATKSMKPSFLPDENDAKVRVGKRTLSFSNLNKKYWPDLTKRDLLNYYHEVAPFLLPYLKDRPLSLNRYPNGISGKMFLQKDVSGQVPDWLHTLPYHPEDDPDADKHFAMADDEASLLYLVNMGTIDPHPWSSTASRPDHPTWCIIDIDPDKQTYDQVVETALAVRDILSEYGIESYPKTSGATGMHVYLPLAGKYTYEQSRTLAEYIASRVHERLPDFTTLERSVKARKGKLYIDYLQNRPQATVAPPYIVRPRPGAPVSTPLHWDEVRKGLDPARFHLRNTLDRLRQTGDLFAPVLKKGADLRRLLETGKE